jgi:molecular chaperone DnaK
MVVHSYAGHSMKLEVTRGEFERRCQHLLERAKAICEIALEEAGLDWGQIDRILLTGGMTRMPSVREMIRNMSRRPIAEDVSPDEAVAVGAALQATLVLLEREDDSGERTISNETRGKLSGADGALMRVTNITTHTLGVVLWDDEHLEEYVFAMIKKSSQIPAEVQNSFGTAKANMRNVSVRVVEGESTLPVECIPLGVCEVELPEFLPKGSPVQLTYRYDENQVLEVTIDAYGHQTSVKISRNLGVPEGEMEAATADLMRIKVE